MTFFNVIPMKFEDDIIVIVGGSDVSIPRVGSVPGQVLTYNVYQGKTTFEQTAES